MAFRSLFRFFNCFGGNKWFTHSGSSSCHVWKRRSSCEERTYIRKNQKINPAPYLRSSVSDHCGLYHFDLDFACRLLWPCGQRGHRKQCCGSRHLSYGGGQSCGSVPNVSGHIYRFLWRWRSHLLRLHRLCLLFFVCQRILVFPAMPFIIWPGCLYQMVCQVISSQISSLCLTYAIKKSLTDFYFCQGRIIQNNYNPRCHLEFTGNLPCA